MVTINANSKTSLGNKLWILGWWTLIALGFIWMASGLVTGILGFWAALS